MWILPRVNVDVLQAAACVVVRETRCHWLLTEGVLGGEQRAAHGPLEFFQGSSRWAFSASGFSQGQKPTHPTTSSTDTTDDDAIRKSTSPRIPSDPYSTYTNKHPPSFPPPTMSSAVFNLSDESKVRHPRVP